MTRKRYVKLMMASGSDRNTANYIGIDPSKCHPCVPQERKLICWAYRGSLGKRQNACSNTANVRWPAAAKSWP